MLVLWIGLTGLSFLVSESLVGISDISNLEESFFDFLAVFGMKLFLYGLGKEGP